MFQVQASDPVTFATLAVVLVAVAGVASFVPASRVDPLSSIRYE